MKKTNVFIGLCLLALLTSCQEEVVSPTSFISKSVTTTSEQNSDDNSYRNKAISVVSDSVQRKESPSLIVEKPVPIVSPVIKVEKAK